MRYTHYVRILRPSGVFKVLRFKDSVAAHALGLNADSLDRTTAENYIKDWTSRAYSYYLIESDGSSGGSWTPTLPGLDVSFDVSFDV
jgi:hypothetical protein